jgi:transcription elongation factor Elf1
MDGDKVALANSFSDIAEAECGDCGVATEIEVETEYHRYSKTATWLGHYTCPQCNYEQDVEGWYYA